MSRQETASKGLSPLIKSAPWGLWFRQTMAVTRFETRKSFAGRRWIAAFLLAGGPLFLLTMRLFLDDDPGTFDGSTEGLIFATMFQSYILRMAIFFGCVGIFTQLFRGEVLEKTLHYYLLAPVRREIIMTGKYLAGLLNVAVLFVPATMLSYLVMYMPYGSRVMENHFVNGVGIPHMLTYGGVAFLACAGYGAVFLLMGIIARNPLVPAMLVLGWESLNIFLPATLQKISVIHYLQSITPVPLPFGPLEVITEPTSPWVSVPGLLIMTLAVLMLAAYKMRRAEVSYSTD